MDFLFWTLHNTPFLFDQTYFVFTKFDLSDFITPAKRYGGSVKPCGVSDITILAQSYSARLQLKGWCSMKSCK
jgi:hypothetical protein